MANPEHVELLEQGIAKWNNWLRERRQERITIIPDLRGANLSGANLSGANLEGADLSEAILIGATFFGTRLVGANLFRAHLSGASFSGANIREAKFNEAKIGRTTFAGVDLGSAKGLDAVEHLAPSSIGVDCIYASEGRISEIFLRGCGLPETFVRFYISLFDNPDDGITPPPAIEIHPSIFITYSYEDKSFARRLHDGLQARGVRCWLDEKPALPWDDVYEQVDHKIWLWDKDQILPQSDQKIQNWKIRLWDKVLLCASNHSLTSWWVEGEIECAFVKDWFKTGKGAPKPAALLLINLDDFLLSDECQIDDKQQVLSRLVADFIGWENDDSRFEEQLELVVKALSERDGVMEMNSSRGKFMKFHRRIWELALMDDPLKIQEILGGEYGMRLSADEIRTLQERGPKVFSFGVIHLWAAKQPHEALAWAASTPSWTNNRWDFHQIFLEAARETLPNLDRDMLDGILPEGPGKVKMLDLAEAATIPYSLANRILTAADTAERATRLKTLAQGWPDPETSAEWARQNLSGDDKTAFYSQVGFNLAHQNPEGALRVLAELKDTDAYVSTFVLMMRGLVQIGGQGQYAAELIANSDLDARDRANLISELSRRWVRQDAGAAIAWVDSLTAPEDVRAAVPLLISQLDSDRVSRAVEAYLKNPDPVMELALIEAAAPPGLGFNPRKSRMILDPLISKDPGLKLRSSEAYGNNAQSDLRDLIVRDLRDLIARRAYEIYEERGRSDGEAMNDWLRAEAEVKSSVMAEKRRAIERRGSNKHEILWDSVTKTAKRLAEVGPPADAMEWLDTLPFASQRDYASAAGAVLAVWNLKSPTEAADWLQNSTLDPALKSVLRKIVQQ